MIKKINFGKIDYLRNGKRTCPVEVRLELKENNDKPVFSCCGDIYNHLHTDIYCGGQCLDTIAEYVKCKTMKTILRLWKSYHLNDMHPGTKRQEEELNKVGLTQYANKHSECCDYLKSIGLYEDNGYRFGCGWQYWEIPQEDLELIKKLMAD